MCITAVAARPAAAQPLPQDLPLGEQAPDSFLSVFHTTKGRFVIKAHRRWAPIGVDRLYALVRSGFFNGDRVYRVGPTISYPGGYVVQFGLNNDPALNRAWEAARIQDEPVRQRHRRGMVTFSREAANARTVEIAIDLSPNTGLDTVQFRGAVGFPVIGEVTEGMDVLDRLYREYGNTPRDNRDSIIAKGSEYLDRVFPRLDRIRVAYISTIWR
jgi:cyclophilin family peptidyl-prolyl cis-trans isomerase